MSVPRRIAAFLDLAEQDTDAAKTLAATNNRYAAYHCRPATEHGEEGGQRDGKAVSRRQIEGYVMTHEELLARITVNPQVCHGKPCLRGRRIWVSLILGMLEGGMTEQEILAEYPELVVDDIRACIAYANELARGGFVDLLAS